MGGEERGGEGPEGERWKKTVVIGLLQDRGPKLKRGR